MFLTLAWKFSSVLYKWTAWPAVQLNGDEYFEFIKMSLEVLSVDLLQQSLPLQCHWRSWKIHDWRAAYPTFILTNASRGSHSLVLLDVWYRHKVLGCVSDYFRFISSHTQFDSSTLTRRLRWEALQVQAGAEQMGFLNDRYWMMADCVVFHSASLAENKGQSLPACVHKRQHRHNVGYKPLLFMRSLTLNLYYLTSLTCILCTQEF